MPGVPSGRGCEACRKQKKKASWPTQTKQRSSDQSGRFSVTNCSLRARDARGFRSSSLQVRRPPGGRQPSSIPWQGATLQQLLHKPSNEMTHLTSALIGKLDASDDIRYHLCWTYGDYLGDIPKRLGTNEALDTAVAALISAHSCLGPRPGKFATPESIQKYGHALMALRILLDNPVRAREPETLCAVMLLMICQSFIGVHRGRLAGHGEGAAQILKARAFFRTQDLFERKLIFTLRGPVLFEALINPRICLSAEDWNLLVANDFDEPNDESQMIRCLAHLPGLMDRGKTALREHTDVQHVVLETRQYYGMLKVITQNFKNTLHTIQQAQVDGNSPSPKLLQKAHAWYQRSHGLALGICIIFNCVLEALEPNDIELDIEAQSFCDSILVLADEAAIYRPLGASYVPICLAAAWCGSKDEITRAIIEAVLVDYGSDFTEQYVETLASELQYASLRLSLLDP
ncbi:hypothetical protein BP5796_05625 [Coleophoma crateriformis]|uniref:Transcription factor domain-containing protein n=1 Tax=Coleophoma crateriformis TaxID=565419 RepID=A0A3D8S3P0_9HELO|nr:hypothetical protein BP5796_05625 [Coleophoma crateriformis]